MPWFVTVMLCAAAALPFFGKRLLDELHIRLWVALPALVLGAVLYFVPAVTLFELRVFPAGLFMLVTCAYLLSRARNIARVLAGVLAVWCVLAFAELFVSPLPQGFLSEPALLVGMIAGLTALAFAQKEAMGALFAAVITFRLGESTVERFAMGINSVIEICAETDLVVLCAGGVAVGLLMLKKQKTRRKGRTFIKKRRDANNVLGKIPEPADKADTRIYS